MESSQSVARKRRTNGHRAAARRCERRRLGGSRFARAAGRAAGDAGGKFQGAPAGIEDRGRRQGLRCVQHHRLGQSAHRGAARARRRGGRTAGQDPHARALRVVRRRLGRYGGVRQHADRRPAVADHGGHPHGDGGRARRPSADGAARRGRTRAQGRVPALREHRQHHDQAALGVHLRGDARGARSGHGRQARRAGAGARGHRAFGRI